MDKIWLQHNVGKDIIIFFNGWGMDTNMVKHLVSYEFDLLIIQNYKTLEPIEIQNQYHKIYLIAWSFGVFAASQIFQSKAQNMVSIAINGTEEPINKKFGIAPEIFKGTLDNWDATNAQKFMNRIFGNHKTKTDYAFLLPMRQPEEQKEELFQLQNLVLTKKISTFTWDFSIIGMNDAIFLPSNQKNYWQTKSIIITKNWPHAPFHLFNSWNNLLKEITTYDK